MKALTRLVAVLTLAWAGTANAGLMTWVYQTQVVIVEDSGGANPFGVAVGDMMTVSLTFDSDSALTVFQDFGPVPDDPALHPPSIGSSFKRNSALGTDLVSFSYTLFTSIGVQQIQSGSGCPDRDILRHSENGPIGADLLNVPPDTKYDEFFALHRDNFGDCNLDERSFGFRLSTNTSPSDVFPLDMLRTSQPDPADIFGGRASYSLFNDDTFFQFVAYTKDPSGMPLPSTLALFGLGLLALRRRIAA